MNYQAWTATDFTLCAIGTGFTAISVWLTVRVVNRKERWAKWMLAVTLSLPVLYVVGFGPACWLAAEEKLSLPIGKAMCRFYGPLISHVMLNDDGRWSVCALYWWSSVGTDKGDVIELSYYDE